MRFVLTVVCVRVLYISLIQDYSLTPSLCNIDFEYVNRVAMYNGDISSELKSIPMNLLLDLSGRSPYTPRESGRRMDIILSILLVLAGIETNPGPGIDYICFGSLNAQISCAQRRSDS